MWWLILWTWWDRKPTIHPQESMSKFGFYISFLLPSLNHHDQGNLGKKVYLGLTWLGDWSPGCRKRQLTENLHLTPSRKKSWHKIAWVLWKLKALPKLGTSFSEAASLNSHQTGMDRLETKYSSVWDLWGTSHLNHHSWIRDSPSRCG